MSERPPVVSRRALLGGTLALAGAAGLVSPATAQSCVVGGEFDLRVDAYPYLLDVGTHDVTVMQSFTVDYVNEHIYVIQIQQGRRAYGDLVVSQLTFEGDLLGRVLLNGFGHGVNIAVEPRGCDTYIWTETDSKPDTGYGRAITCFPFEDGLTLTYGVSNIPVFRPVPGSLANTPDIDLANNRIAVRHNLPQGRRYAIYDLDDFKASQFTPIYSFDQVGIMPGESFQGWALYGNYVYQMTGTSYTDENGSNPPSARGNCYLSSIDVRTGQLVDRARTKAGWALSFREPEGMAVMPSDPPLLMMGYASGGSGARRANFYYKSQ